MNISTGPKQFLESNGATKQPGMIETMNTILGSNYQILKTGLSEPIVLSKLPDEDLAPINSVDESEVDTEMREEPSSQQFREKTPDDFIFQMYLGTMTVVGLFVLFRMIQKSR